MSLWNRIRSSLVGPSKVATEQRAPAPGDGIDAFWQFWAAHQADLLAAIDNRTLPDWTERVSAAVKEIHPRLGWEFGAGRNARHYFCISGGGDMPRRLLAERWLQRAPAPSKEWEFYPAKPPARNITSTSIDGVTLDFADVRVASKRASFRLMLDVQVYHPAWSKLSADDRSVAGFVFLDSLLGEDDVCRWLFAIDMVTEPPPNHVPLQELKEQIAKLAQETQTGVILKAKTASGNAMIASVNTDVKRIDHLGMDAQLEVRVAFAARADGLCDQAAADELNALEDELLELLGADAVFAGRRTFEGTRVLHFRCAAQGTAASRADAWARRQSTEIEVACTLDPNWETMPW